jgi:hypothetical protein
MKRVEVSYLAAIVASAYAALTEAQREEVEL